MSHIGRGEERREFREEASSLWLITIAPTIWALHFVLVYGATAVICAKAATLGAFETLRQGIAVATLLALVLILVVAWRSWLQWDYLTDYEYSHALPTGEHRHEFLGHAAFLLAVMSAIAVVFTALPALFIDGCM